MPLLVIQSIGLVVVYVTLQIVIVSAAPADRVSEATGMMTVIRATAMAIGAQTVATLLSATGHHGAGVVRFPADADYITVRSEEHTSELQSLIRISYAVFCL